MLILVTIATARRSETLVRVARVRLLELLETLFIARNVEKKEKQSLAVRVVSLVRVRLLELLELGY